MKISSITAAVIAVCASTTALADPAGKVLALAGTATIERAGQQVPLQPGASVESGDVLTVGDRSTLQVRFTDESVVALRANSQFRIEDYRFTKNAETDRSLLGLLKGGMRTITGLIGKANQKNYSVQTATATIGIRGTHFSVVSCNNDCTRPDGTREPNGTFGGVTDGRITVSNQSGSKEFGQQDYFHVPSVGAPPVQLLAPPAILNDRALVARGSRSTSESGATANASSGSSRGSGANTSTSPQLVVQQSPSVELNSPIATVAATEQPATLRNAGLGTGRITVLEAKKGQGTGADINFRNYTIAELRAEAPNLGGTYFYDAASAAVAINQRIATVGSSAAAGAYWIYEAPSSSDLNRIGSHHAFGDSPTISLPTSGIAQYSYAGGTAPTDNFGRTGSFSASTLTMNFGSQQVSNNSAMTFSFGTNALQATPTVYSVGAGASWSMGGGVQNLASTTCTTGCTGTTSGAVIGRFVGTTLQGYAASFSVGNTQLNASQPNAAANVAVFAKQ
ncbi:MAG: FecR family protein [Pseudomonadota bacterium]